MSLADRLLAIQEAGEETRQREARPPGWEPGVIWDGKTGQITTGALTEPPDPNDWSELLRARGLDPDLYEVDGETIKWCSWDGWYRPPEGGQAISRICYSFRATIRRKRGKTEDFEHLYKEYRKKKAPRKDPKTVIGESALTVCLADWQTGNGDVELADQLETFAQLPEIIADHASSLRRRFDLSTIALVGMGDLVENTCGFYSYQPFVTLLDRREQVRVVRRALLEIVSVVAKLGIPVMLTGVAGNHGENRQGTKAHTGTNDNDDVGVIEQVADIISVNPDAFGHVDVKVPKDRLAISLNLGSQIVAFTHGHVAKPTGGPVNAMWSWWEKQAHGRYFPGVADADILVTGHFHHLNVKSNGDRTLFICPPTLPVGKYFGDANGTKTKAGTLTFVTNPDGWTALEVLPHR